MPLYPDINDRYNDLLYKLAKNLYDRGITLGKSASDLSEPSRGWTDFDLLKSAVINSAVIAS